MGYFDQKIKVLQMKVLPAPFNKEISKFCDNIPKRVTVEYLPILSMRLLELMEVILDEAIDLKETTKEIMNISNDTKKSNSSQDYINDVTINHSGERTNKRQRAMQITTKMKANSTIFHISQKMCNSTLLFVDETDLLAMFDTKNSHIRRTLLNHLKPFHDTTSSVLEVDLKQGYDSIVDAKIRCNILEHEIRHLIIKRWSNSNITKGISHVIDMTRRCERLEILEFEEHFRVLRNDEFIEMANEISRKHKYLKQFMCSTKQSSPSEFIRKRMKEFLENCESIKTVVIHSKDDHKKEMMHRSEI